MQDQRITRTCAHCNTAFLIKRSRAANGRGTFCSLPCKRAAGYLDKSCSVDDCERPAWNRGWCRLHYGRWFRTGSVDGRPRVVIPAEQRLWSRVDKHGPIPDARPDLGPCWLWTGSLNNSGYGSLQVGDRALGAHVFAYQLMVGPIPKGLEPDHLCFVRRCVNPGHLEPVTRRENLRRAVAAGRAPGYSRSVVSASKKSTCA
jgi:hypothetical protein